MSLVKVEYTDFSRDNSEVQKITFELLPNTILTLVQDGGSLNLSMSDESTDNVEISGTLDLESINNLIRSLTIFRNQVQTQAQETVNNEE